MEISLTCDPQLIRLRIADDGEGFEPIAPRPGKHLGLWSMRERVEQLGGQFQVESLLRRGTELIITIPASGQVVLSPTD